MSKSTLRKTLLAASIAASSQVYAASGVTDLTQDVSGSTEAGFNLTDHANVTLTGDAKRALGEDGVGFEGAKIRGDLINNADISAEGQYVDGLDLDVADLEGTIVTTDVAGDVINNGLIELTGEGSVGIVLDGANAKNLVNNGTIDVLDDSDSTGADKVRGIELGNSTLKGGVLNTGTIIATGDGAKGITAFSNGLGLTTIGGDIENQGNLSISGDNSIGIELDNVKFGNNLLNNGGLSATGSSATSLLVDDTSYNSIVNTGASLLAASVMMAPMQTPSL